MTCLGWRQSSCLAETSLTGEPNCPRVDWFWWLAAATGAWMLLRKKKASGG